MLKAIKDRFNAEILAKAAARYGVDPGVMQVRDGFESFIYEFNQMDDRRILRISHSSRRGENMIRGEVDWIKYLAEGGVSVAQAAVSQNGELVEPLDDGHGDHFLAVSFHYAPGVPPWELGWSTELFHSYGRLLGRMHALSKGYLVPEPAWKRPEWNAPIMLEIVDYLPPDQPAILDHHDALMERLDALPRDAGGYGLIHQDAHGGNMHVDSDGRITLFDFDDCVYSWFIYDIAMVVFYMIVNVEDPDSLARSFLPHFMDGYFQETTLDTAWFAYIPDFLKLREIDLYSAIHRSFDLEHLDNPWVARFMAGRRERLEKGWPFVDIDFTKFV